MKKIMFISTAALVLFLTSTNGAVPSKLYRTAIVQEKDVTYKEISVDKLPPAVVQTLDNEYKDFAKDKAFMGSDNSYKVDISKGTMKHTIFLSEQGKILKTD